MKLRIVKASQGYVWLRQGLQVSLRQSFQFVGLLGLCVSAALLLIGLPVVGPLLVVGCTCSARSRTRAAKSRESRFVFHRRSCNARRGLDI